MELVSVQIAALFVLLLGTFICGCLPILCFKTLKCFSDSKGQNKTTWFLIFFGGGVLMSTCFLHLLPEAREAFPKPEHKNALSAIGASSVSKEGGENTTNKHFHKAHRESFPLPEFLMLCGFFATYFIEEIIHFLFVHFRGHGNENELGTRFCSCAQRDTECSRMYKDVKPDGSLFGGEKMKQQNTSPAASNPVPQPSPSELLQSSILDHNLPNYGTVSGTATAVQEPNSTSLRGDSVPLLDEPRLDYVSLGSLLTVAALSFHSVFEGFAIGFQRTTLGTWTLLFAVAMHKFVIAFVVGVEVIAEGGRASLVFAYMGVFACMSPIGMAVAISTGMSLQQTSPDLEGALSCIATGTLLYVTFFEILQRKSNGHFNGLCRFIATGLGAGFMALVQYFTTVL